MSLTNNQYQTVMRIYDERRSNAIRIRNNHLEEVRSKLPEYSNLEDMTSQVAISYGMRLIEDESASIDDMDQELRRISEAKRNLLIQNGFDPSYVEIKYSCPDCEDTGYVGNDKCHCFHVTQLDLLLSQSHIRKFLQTENFSNLREDMCEGEDLSRLKKAVQMCHEFVDNFDTNYQNFLFCGTVGTGKSFLSCCIAHDLIESGHSVIYYSATDLFNTISANTFHKDEDQSDGISNRDLYECDLLIIDDLGTEIGGQFVNSSLFTCLNERYLRHKAVIISTNLSLEELQNRYSDRVFSRLLGNFDRIMLTGADRRVNG